MYNKFQRVISIFLSLSILWGLVIQKAEYINIEAATESDNYATNSGSSIYNNDIAQIFIDTEGNAKKSGIDLFTDTSKGKVTARIIVKTENGESIEADGYGKINVRGNSTCLAQKKPYNIKFDDKKNLFGMGDAKKWSLLANTFDKSLIRTQVGMKFLSSLEEGHISGHQYTSKCKPVDLYIDGKYLGTYLLIESVEAGASRVDIDVDYIGEDDSVLSEKVKEYTINGKTYKLQDALLEVANDVKSNSGRYDNEAYYIATNNMNIGLSLNEPQRDTNAGYGYKIEDTNKPEFVLEIKKFLDDMENVVGSSSYGDSSAQMDAISQYIDLESFVDFYITSELFMTKDISFSSTRFYIKNGKLYAGPLWDVDLSSGNIIDHEGYEDFYAQKFKWFSALMKNTEFKNMVVGRYKELQGRITRIYSDGGNIDKAYEEIKKSAKCNYESAYNVFSSSKNDYCNGWGYNSIYGISHAVWWGDDTSWLSANNGVYGSKKVYNDYEAYVNSFKTWMENRNQWLLSQWGIELSDKLSGGIEINGFQISPNVPGVRTVYSVDSQINGKDVVNSGVIYSLADYADEKELYVGSKHKYVVAVESTEKGIRYKNISSSDIALTYAMTMEYSRGDRDEYKKTWKVRAYAELSDGTYVYTDIREYTIYNIADYLYQNSLMKDSREHDYLYEQILSKVNSEYIEKTFIIQ